MENKMVKEKKATMPATVITPEALLDHWQGHRRLTRKMIEAFPEDKFFNYSVGGMRPFSELVMEMIGLAGPGLHGILTNEWQHVHELSYHTKSGLPKTKEETLRLWDKLTEEINTAWAKIPLQRFQETVLAFGEYEGPVWGSIFYWIDNEIHHRGQGYVYLRSLGIEPPAFWDRY